MRKAVFTLILMLSVLSACTKNNANRALNYVFNRYSLMQAELTKLDAPYASYFDSLCNSKDIVKFDNAENIFQAATEWKQKRTAITVKYQDIYFDGSNTLIKEFKDQQIIDNLIWLTDNFKAVEESVDTSFLISPKCETKYTQAEADYQNPAESKTCLISCPNFKHLSQSIESLSAKEAIVVNKSKERLTRYLKK